MILGVADFSSIEARTLLWLAGDEAGLDVYRSGRDPYKELAADIYSVSVDDVTDDQRSVAKVGTLACGYQGGPGAVERFAAGYGVDLEALGVTPGGLVEAWRDGNPAIAGERNGRTWKTPEGRVVILREGGLWRELKATAEAVVRNRGVCVPTGRCEFYMSDGGGGPHLIVLLPSGRELVYRDARYETVDALWGGTTRCVTYQSARGFRKSTFGGLWAENLAQAVSRDLLGHALVLLEAYGFRVVLHVHDEVVCELPNEGYLDSMMSFMKTTPAWAKGFPLDADGFAAERYGK